MKKSTKTKEDVRNICMETLYNCTKKPGSTNCKFFEPMEDDKKECMHYEKDAETCTSIKAWFNDAMVTMYTINKLNELEAEMLKEKIKEITNKNDLFPACPPAIKRKRKYVRKK